MSFICNKTINNKKYAYEITSIWDSETKKVKKKSKYLGIIDIDGAIVKKHDRKIKQEKLLLDFGDGFLLDEFIKQTNLYPILTSDYFKEIPEILPLIYYRLVFPSAMYNAVDWNDGSVISLLHKNTDLSSQNISRILAYLGDEKIQRHFFEKYLKKVKQQGNAAAKVQESVIIDATSLPNKISSGFNAWGKSDNAIEKQFRFLCVVDKAIKVPLFYRLLPGNMVDISTLQNTISELQKMGIKNSFTLLDAGYCSEANIKSLYKSKIDFLTRLPAGRKLYADLIKHHSSNLEKAVNAVRYNHRTLFIEEVKTELYGATGYAYLVLDLARKSKEIDKIFAEKQTEATDEELQNEFNNAGIMVLISSQPHPPKEVIQIYYTRQIIEQIFGFFKSDLDSLPIRRHNDDTVRGYLFLQFLALILFIQLREKLQDKFTVEQALLIMKNLKCKKFADVTIINESTKKQKEIAKLCKLLVPKSLGI